MSIYLYMHMTFGKMIGTEDFHYVNILISILKELINLRCKLDLHHQNTGR